MKVKDVIEFLEASDPECRIVIQVRNKRGVLLDADLTNAEDNGVGFIVLKGEV